MTINELSIQIKTVFYTHAEIAFAYLHGSSLCSPSPRDIDIAIYLDNISNTGKKSSSFLLDYVIPLEQELKHGLNLPIDLQLLNNAPLSFRYRVTYQGLLIIDRSLERRENFELFTRLEYFDFRHHREQYLKEALT
jgi:predicted nucleotidyltransferase